MLALNPPGKFKEAVADIAAIARVNERIMRLIVSTPLSISSVFNLLISSKLLIIDLIANVNVAIVAARLHLVLPLENFKPICGRPENISFLRTLTEPVLPPVPKVSVALINMIAFRIEAATR